MSVQSAAFAAGYAAAGYANLAQWVSNSLKAIGLVRVGSSRPAVAGGGNQAADYTGVANPATTNTLLDWEIWRFNDAVHATFPVYFRIYWRTGNGTATINLLLKIGTGWDGVSDVNGNTYTEQNLISTTGAAGTTAYSCYVIGDTNRVIVGLWMGADSQAAGTTPAICFGIERTHNSDGTDNDEGVYVLTQYGSSTPTHNNQVITRPALGANGQLETKLGNCLIGRNNFTMYGLNAAIGAIYPMRGRALYPSRNFVLCGKNDLGSSGALMDFDHYYGIVQKWISFSRNQTLTFDGSLAVGHGLLARFE